MPKGKPLIYSEENITIEIYKEHYKKVRLLRQLTELRLELTAQLGEDFVNSGLMNYVPTNDFSPTSLWRSAELILQQRGLISEDLEILEQQ